MPTKPMTEVEEKEEQPTRKSRLNLFVFLLIGAKLLGLWAIEGQLSLGPPARYNFGLAVYVIDLCALIVCQFLLSGVKPKSRTILRVYLVLAGVVNIVFLVAALAGAAGSLISENRVRNFSSREIATSLVELLLVGRFISLSPSVIHTALVLMAIAIILVAIRKPKENEV